MLQIKVTFVLKMLPLNINVMSNQCEIVYYLDNNDMAIIEVEQKGYSGLRNILWVVYHKATQSVNRFSFRPTFSKTKAHGQKFRKGFLNCQVLYRSVFQAYALSSPMSGKITPGTCLRFKVMIIKKIP